ERKASARRGSEIAATRVAGRRGSAAAAIAAARQKPALGRYRRRSPKMVPIGVSRFDTGSTATAQSANAKETAGARFAQIAAAAASASRARAAARKRGLATDRTSGIAFQE